MNKKILLLPIILIITGWGFRKKKDLFSYVESARPSQTRTLKALAARLYLEALECTDAILDIAHRLEGIESSNIDTTKIKHNLRRYLSSNEKRDETVRRLTNPVINTFNDKVAKILDTSYEKNADLIDLLTEYKAALTTLNMHYIPIMNALDRVKATYAENTISLPESLNFKTLGISDIINASSSNTTLKQWLAYI